MSKFYYCYSYNQKDYLISNGEFSVVKGIHPDTGKRYWVFERNDNLDRLLNQWQLNKKNLSR